MASPPLTPSLPSEQKPPSQPCLNLTCSPLPPSGLQARAARKAAAVVAPRATLEEQRYVTPYDGFK